MALAKNTMMMQEESGNTKTAACTVRQPPPWTTGMDQADKVLLCQGLPYSRCRCSRASVEVLSLEDVEEEEQEDHWC